MNKYNCMLVEDKKLLTVFNNGEGVLLFAVNFINDIQIMRTYHNVMFWNFMVKLENVTGEVWSYDRVNSLLDNCKEV